MDAYTSLMCGGDPYDEPDCCLEYPSMDPLTYPDVPAYCCTEMDPEVLAKYYFKASKRGPDGGIPGKSPHVITKEHWWPLGFGEIRKIEDQYQEGDWYWVIDPADNEVVSLDDYGKTWVLYCGPDDDRLWSAMREFQSTPAPEPVPVSAPEPTPEIVFEPIETDELPF